MDIGVIARLERSFEVPDPSDAKSKAAAEKILKMRFSGQRDPLEEKVAKLEDEFKKFKSKLTKKTG